jgi:epoxyqueuosine reductase
MELNLLEFKHKIVSVKRFPDLQSDIDVLLKGKKLSTNPVYRSYIDTKNFTIPKEFTDANSVIIIAKKTRIAYIDFTYLGKKHTLLLPSPYYDDGTKSKDLEYYIYSEIFHQSKLESTYKIQRTKSLFLKTLAVRSGLSKYGRNNISYADEFGSFYDLYSYFTNFEPEAYDWSDKRLMELCENCKICTNICPTSAIQEDEFVINVERCLPLYNEVSGEFPPDLPTGIHHTLMGCVKCQFACPANKNIITYPRYLEPITEEETRMVLESRRDDVLARSFSEKLKMFPFEQYERYLPVIQRNLSVLLN